MAMRPMSERRERWRLKAASAPGYGYSWLRAELRSLDRHRDASLVLKIRTAVPRRRIMRAATAYINSARQRLDRAIVRDDRDLDSEPRGLRTMYRQARDEYDRMWIAAAWCRSSAELVDDAELEERVQIELDRQFVRLAEAVARIAGDG